MYYFNFYFFFCGINKMLLLLLLLLLSRFHSGEEKTRAQEDCQTEDLTE